MAGRRFLILLADFKGQEEPDPKMLVKQLDLALDWVRLTPSSWLLYTSKDAKIWYTRFRKISEKGRVFISQVDGSDKSGYMPKPVWEFIRKHQNEVRQG